MIHTPNDPLRQNASDLLYLLGFKEADTDPLFDICLRSAAEHIRNATNQQEIPAGLAMAAARRAAGEYLRLVLASGLSEADMENAVAAAGAITEIRESEVTVKFQSVQTVEQKFAALTDWLTAIDQASLIRWRRIAW